tara:strand:+ start:105 stop:467 length:363 start_codon:yes stop_codon:yes gene_type:complete
MKQIILILLIFIIGCEPKKEKINLETFLIGDLWCYDNVKNIKICFEFTSGAVIVNANGEKMNLTHKIVKTDYDTNTIYSEIGYGGTMEGVINTWKVLHKDTIQFRQQGDDDKNIIWRVKL